MSSERIDFIEAERVKVGDLNGKTNVQVLAGALVLPNNAAPLIQYLDSGGSARNIDLPAPAGNDGKILIFCAPNGTGALTVRKTGGGATVVTVAVGKMGIAVCVNGDWFGGTLG